MSLKSRLEALEQRARQRRDMPPDDPLSRSLYKFGEELSRLDEAEKKKQAEVLGITRTDFDRMATAYKKPNTKRRF